MVMQDMPTIKDIAKKAEVSVATVSYVLNNRNVSSDKRERVLRAIEELNYVPNAIARKLRVRSSKTLNLIVSDITNPFYPDLAKACDCIAQSEGFTVNMVNTNDQDTPMLRSLSQLRDGTVDGAIITTAMERNRSILEEIIQRGLPIVVAHRRIKGLRADIVTSDNFNGSIMATNHLLRLGHKKIAFMTGVEGSSVNEERTAGYLAAMEQAGLRVQSEWLLSGEARYNRSYEVTKILMNLPKSKRPSAIINLSDIGAIGVMDSAHDLGIRVPDDLAVVGFDDLFISSTRNIQLTTIKIPRYEMGLHAATLLVDRIGNSGAHECQEIVLPVTLIVRQTCGSS